MAPVLLVLKRPISANESIYVATVQGDSPYVKLLLKFSDITKPSQPKAAVHIRGPEVEKDIDELEEPHSQELTTEEVTELRYGSQQEVLEEILSEEEDVTTNQQSSGSITKMLKAWATLASNIKQHHRSLH
ncbi:hypothetical protein AVEN_256383-1 [Araneus ventricosus]|uniref:Uncharacterized protein n=1 Tax=Araneus ventricosus TaxID=182803 RepID=A0A4Y2MIR6_ARAVE|nr:hypothetical protein AVEN_256383-1 [Araneus ventricosus]